MNEILKKRIEQAAIDGSKHYDPNVSKYSQGKQVGYLRGFKEGAEYALTHQWISVKEALPVVEADGCSEYVLVMSLNLIPQIASYSDGANTTKYTYKGKDGKKHEAHWFLLNFNPILYDVTHWMPIPELKTDENGE